MTDPYELLRSARDIIAKRAAAHIPEAVQWMKDYKKLPGAKLSKRDIRILRNPHRRHVPGTQRSVARLRVEGYLVAVSCIGGPESRWTQVRLSPMGREALRLRENVK